MRVRRRGPRKAFAIVQNDFDQIHMLRAKEFSISQISKIIGWSGATVSRVVKYKTFDEYRKYLDIEKAEAYQRTHQNKPVKVGLPVKPEFKDGLAKAEETKTVITALMEIANEIHLLRLAWEKPGKYYVNTEPIDPESIGLKPELTPAEIKKRSWMPFGKTV